MSYMQQVQKVGDAHYVLPKLGDMRVHVDAFLSEALFAGTDEGLWNQAAQSASYPGAIGMYLMPDTHLGYSIPVGGVLVTEDVIVQAGSGYDISCGVIYLKVPGLTAADVVDWKKRQWWIEQIGLRVATGVGSNRPSLMKNVSHRVIEDVFRYGAKAVGIKADLCERQYIDVPEDFDFRKIDRAYSKAKPQLGSVGGGNHFIEMQVDKADGSVWIMIHCGSRGYGWQTANHYFYEGSRLRGLAPNRRELSWLRADEPLGKEYWAAHNSAANYAIANRWTIVEGVREATQAVFKQDVEPYYEISHNLVQEETLVLPDGTTKKGFVHRKGATRAFPAHHPDLWNTPWWETGHPVLIPGSMLDGAAILFPQEGAYRSGCSVNHGSGRLMGRGAAKRELAHIHDDIDNEMRDIKRVLGGVEITGIVGNCERTPLDECGHVYKDLDEVLRVLETEGIAKIAHRMYPVANVKGMD